MFSPIARRRLRRFRDNRRGWISLWLFAGLLLLSLGAELVANDKPLLLGYQGELYTPATIRERLTMRNFMEELRSAGIETGGPAAFSQADRQAFGNQLDRLLAKIPPPACK